MNLEYYLHLPLLLRIVNTSRNTKLMFLFLTRSGLHVPRVFGDSDFQQHELLPFEPTK